MKLVITGLIVLTLAVLALGVLLWVATPKPWPISQGTLKVKKVKMDGQSFVMIDGEPMNKLGQVQSINVQPDNEKRRLVVQRCIVRWNPFTSITVNNQWPIFYPVESLKPGEYKVVYTTSEGEAIAGSFELP